MNTTPTRASGSLVLLLLCMAQFMLILDISIVNVALPSMQTDLAIPRENLQLVVTLYALTFGGLLLLGGRIADVWGRKRIFLIGVAIFTIASLICGIAQSQLVLIAARALQGVGGALVSPAALSLLTSIFPEGSERNRALGVWSLVAAVGGAAGLLLGGILINIANWRWVFILNVPIGILVMLLTLRALPTDQRTSGGRIDLGGALTITLSFMALVYGLGQGEQQRFNSPVVLLLLASALVLLMAFIVIERRLQQPLLPLSLFRLRTLTGANIATLLLSAVIIGGNFFLTLYFQQVLGYSPLETALAFLPQTAASAIASIAAARWVARLGNRVLFIVGMLSLALGSALLTQLSPQGSYLITVLPGLLLISVGLGIGFTMGTLAATAGVDPVQQGVASGVFNTSQQIGGAGGLALLATIAARVTETSVSEAAQALSNGFNAAFWGACGFSIVAAVVVYVFIREHDSRQELERRADQPHQTTVISTHTAVCACQPAAVDIAAPKLKR